MSEIARFSVAGPDADVASHAVEFEAFFDAEKDQLYRAICLVTRNRHEAEDLTQEAFIRLLERWDRVAGGGGPSRLPVPDGDERLPAALRAGAANREALEAARPCRRRDR